MTELKPNLNKQIKKLHRLTVCTRWLTVVLCWLTLGIFGIKSLLPAIHLWFDYFTWSAVRYTIHFNPLPSICLTFCVGMTVSVLVWQSRNILWGLSPQEKYRLEQKVQKIIAQGSSHPLWRFIV